MINFYTFKTLNEAADETTHIKHLNHSEENVFHGKHSLNHAIESLSAVHNKLQGKRNNTEISTKLDGSVSLVFGHHPLTKKFFVATKSAFNKEPKLNYTHEDIEHNHGHAPGLVEKLHHALDHLPKVSGKEGIYQSDLMYSGDDKKTDAKGDHHFTPNTITYHVNKNSPHHKEVSDSKIGIAVHTKYEGVPHHAGTLEGMKATQFDGRKNLQHHKDVHLTDTNFKMNNFLEYQNAAQRTLPILLEGKDNINHMLFGLITEVGELVDTHKRALAYKTELDMLNIEEEMGDILWYLAGLATFYKLSLNNVASKNIAKLRTRFPEKFEEVLAVNRNTDEERKTLNKQIGT